MFPLINNHARRRFFINSLEPNIIQKYMNFVRKHPAIFNHDMHYLKQSGGGFFDSLFGSNKDSINVCDSSKYIANINKYVPNSYCALVLNNTQKRYGCKYDCKTRIESLSKLFDIYGILLQKNDYDKLKKYCLEFIDIIICCRHTYISNKDSLAKISNIFKKYISTNKKLATYCYEYIEKITANENIIRHQFYKEYYDTKISLLASNINTNIDKSSGRAYDDISKVFNKYKTYEGASADLYVTILYYRLKDLRKNEIVN